MTHQQLAKLCLQAYSPAMPDGTVAPIFTALKHGPACFVTGGDPCTVVFRGTCDAEGWLEDLDAWQTAHEPGFVHQGFSDCFNALRGKLLDVVGQRACQITGHSLGGAVACLAAFALKRQCLEVVTFGAPRVGNGAFATALADLGIPHTRYVNQFDPVPWCPALLWGYRHSHAATWFDGGLWRPFSLTAAVALGAVHLFRNLVPGQGWVTTVKHLRDYHQMENYVEALS